jgi:hypothetical protein
MNNLEILSYTNFTLCQRQDDCVIAVVLQEAEKLKRRGALSLNEFERLCLGHGLELRNDDWLVGYIKPDTLVGIRDGFWIGDCKFRSSGDKKCGSVLAWIKGYPEGDFIGEGNILLIRSKWVLEKSPYASP